MKQDINVKWVQITMVSSSINYPFIYLSPARVFFCSTVIVIRERRQRERRRKKCVEKRQECDLYV